MNKRIDFIIFMRVFVIALFTVVVALTILLGCNPEKKIARKLLSSTESVLLDSFSRMKVFKAQLQLTPCDNDTTFITGKPQIIKGADSSYPVYISIPALNNVSKFRAFDTTVKGVKIKCDSLGNIELKLPAPTIIYRTDTAVTRDRQESRRLMQEGIEKDKQIASLNQSLFDKDKTIEKNNKQISSWIWFFIGSIALLILTNFLWMFFKFKI